MYCFHPSMLYCNVLFPFFLQDLSQHLLYACARGLKDAVQLILSSSHDIDLNSPLPLSINTDSNEQGLTPLTLAALSDTVVLCTLLVKGGAGVNATDSLGRSSLHWAVLGGCLGTVNALLKLGADTGIVDSQVIRHPTLHHL